MPESEHIGSLEVKESKLPAMESMKVGSKMTMTVEVEMTGLNKREDWSVDMGPYNPKEKPKKRPKVLFGTFKVLSISNKKQAL